MLIDFDTVVLWNLMRYAGTNIIGFLSKFLTVGRFTLRMLVLGRIRFDISVRVCSDLNVRSIKINSQMLCLHGGMHVSKSNSLLTTDSAFAQSCLLYFKVL